VAQSSSPTKPKWSQVTTPPWPAGHVLGHFNFRFANVLRRVGARGIRCPKSVEAKLGGRLATCTASRSGFGELPPQINGGAHSLHL
jgi:hypothetical protein